MTTVATLKGNPAVVVVMAGLPKERTMTESMFAANEAPRINVEALIAACVPGGSICDPQQVADAIRAYFASGVRPHCLPGTCRHPEMCREEKRCARQVRANAAHGVNACPPTQDGTALIQAIERHIDGWKSATYGWQDDPDPAVAAQNRATAVQAHASECLRRIRAVLADGVPEAPTDLNAVRVAITPGAAEALATQERATQLAEAFADLPDQLRAHPGVKRLYRAAVSGVTRLDGEQR